MNNLLNTPEDQVVYDASMLLGKVIGEALNRIILPQLVDGEAYMLLTPQLADHLVQMYRNTDWSLFTEDDLKFTHLPKNNYADGFRSTNIKGHIGEYFRLTLKGRPWRDVYSAKSFVPGVAMSFWKDAMATVGERMDLALRDTDELSDLLLAAVLCLVNDVSAKDAEKAFLSRIPY